MYEESALVCEVLYDSVGLGQTGFHPDHPGTYLHVVHLHLPSTKESEETHSIDTLTLSLKHD